MNARQAFARMSQGNDGPASSSFRIVYSKISTGISGGFHAARRSNVEPFWRRELSFAASPAVDITETDKSCEITAELPGLDQKDIEVKFANGGLAIKQEDKEQKTKDCYLREGHFARSNATSAFQKGSP
jgi:HSP20 family protein